MEVVLELIAFLIEWFLELAVEGELQPKRIVL